MGTDGPGADARSHAESSVIPHAILSILGSVVDMSTVFLLFIEGVLRTLGFEQSSGRRRRITSQQQCLLLTTPVPNDVQSEIDLIVHATTGTRSRSWGCTSCRPARRAPDDAARLSAGRHEAAWVVDLTRGEPGEPVPMERIHPDGFLRLLPATGRQARFPYRLAGRKRRGTFLGVRRPLSVRAGPHRL